MSVVVIRHASEALEHNPLGDPHERKLACIVPDDLDPEQPVPVLWYLSGYAGVGAGMLSHDPWQEGLEEFPDGHRSTSYRLDVSLPKLYEALTK